MRKSWPLLGLFLCACGGGGSGTETKLTTIYSGYEPAVVDGNIYIRTGGTDPESECADGQALQMWARLVPARTQLIASGSEVRALASINLTVHLGTPAETNSICLSLPDGGHYAACTRWGPNSCDIYISREHDCNLWGHELRHCVHKDYHK